MKESFHKPAPVSDETSSVFPYSFSSVCNALFPLVAFRIFSLSVIFSIFTKICTDIILFAFILLGIAELPESVYLYLSPNLGNFLSLFFEIVFLSCYFNFLFFGVFNYMHVGPFAVVPQVPELFILSHFFFLLFIRLDYLSDPSSGTLILPLIISSLLLTLSNDFYSRYHTFLVSRVFILVFSIDFILLIFPNFWLIMSTFSFTTLHIS